MRQHSASRVVRYNNLLPGALGSLPAMTDVLTCAGIAAVSALGGAKIPAGLAGILAVFLAFQASLRQLERSCKLKFCLSKQEQFVFDSRGEMHCQTRADTVAGLAKRPCSADLS